ncbi:MAG: PTS cellobiose transporter subunit IIC [Bacteroidaceae bacterium]|nr:PTS cellobiose transporter subunit IIC [Bacteroidaceae bacterium]
MFHKEQIVITATEKSTLKAMCRDICARIDGNRALKISFFGLPADNREYLTMNRELHCTVNEFFGSRAPLVSFIAQKSSSDTLIAEVTYLNDSDARITHHSRYKVLERGATKELITEGIIPGDISLSTFEQAKDIFAAIENILTTEGFSPCDIYRQWNYIENITVKNDGSQNYQEFNDARSIFYGKCKWNGGYPAATGIGTARGGVMIELYAIKGETAINKPIDNPMQVAAHSYSQKVLDGTVVKELQERTTPKFERARLLGNTIYISGTAAIKGEDSATQNDTVYQAGLTMEIMNNLISKENIPAPNNGAQYDLLRIYVKHEEAIPAVKEYMNEHYAAVPKHYLVSDICRPELLIEIEGVAHI